jgi:hypothetical protein
MPCTDPGFQSSAGWRSVEDEANGCFTIYDPQSTRQ